MRESNRVDQLIKSLEDKIDSKDSYEVGKIAEELARIHNPKAIKPLILALAIGDIWTFSIQRAIAAFSFEAIASLLSALDHENPAIRSRVVKILSKKSPKISPQVVVQLLEILESGSALSQEGVAKALGELGDAQAVGPLITKLLDGDLDVMIAATVSLGQLRSRKAVKPLISLTQHSSELLRRAAAKALGEIRDIACINSLIILLGDENWAVRKEAARSLSKLGKPASSPLFQRMSIDDKQIRIRVIEASAWAGETAIPPLIVALKDSDWQVRKAAAVSLGITYNETAVKELLTALQDSSSRVCAAAAESLGKIGGASHVPSRGRAAAAKSLESVGLDEVLGSLHDVLQRGSKLTSQAAAKAILNFEGKYVLHIIIQSLKLPNASVRFTMLKAIRDFIHSLDVRYDYFPGWFRVDKDYLAVWTGKSAKTIVNALAELSRDSNDRVCEAAVLALETIRDKLEKTRSESGADTICYAPPGRRGSKELHLELDEEKIAVDVTDAMQRRRYADFTFHFDDRKGKREVPHGSVLNSNRSYQLEIAVRLKPIGIPPRVSERPAIREPLQKNDVTILVTAESDDFDIEEPVQTLILPPSGDSKENAWFSVCPKRRSMSRNDLAKITVRMYYEFNLLEAVVIEAEVVGKDDSSSKSQLGLDYPITFKHKRLEHEYADMDFENIYPRAMHIDITKHGSHYHFNFVFSSEADQEIVFMAPVRLRASDLEEKIAVLRTILLEIAMSKTFHEQVKGDKSIVPKIRMLAREGSLLWSDLFQRRPGSSIDQIGKWIKKHTLRDSGIIQVSVDHDASDFIFPWSLLYDQELPKRYEEDEYKDELPELEGFWGVRYCIEQRLPAISRTDEPIAIEDKLKLGFMLYEYFPNSLEQESLMTKLADQSQGKLEISTPPITRVDRCFELLQAGDANILYFYAHGFAQLRTAGKYTDFRPFLKMMENIPETDSRYERYQSEYEAIIQNQFNKNDSWIKIQHGMIFLRDLVHDIPGKFKHRPLVILNMCESAQITPSLSNSFIDFFINHGAKSVIGTECTMTVQFAHPFGKWLLEGILQGKQVGLTLLNARRHFLLELNNPLGLAYTLYGSATTCFTPPPIVVTPNTKIG